MIRSKKYPGLNGLAIGVFIFSFFFISHILAQDTFKKPVVYRVPGMDSVKTYKDLAYKTVEGMDVKMDIYTPPGLSDQARLPVVIFIHGGPLPPTWTFMPKDWGVYVSYGQLMAASGLVGVTFNHRYYGWDEANLQQSFGDVIDAIQYVRNHAETYHIDPNRICLWAFSGGGLHLAIPLREKMAFVRCIVSYYAILDVVFPAGGLTNVPDKEKLKKFSPLESLTEDNFYIPPILIGRAGLDGLSLNKTVEQFISKALALNETIEVLNHPNGQHGFDILDDDERTREIIARTIEFIQTNLRKEYKPGTPPLPSVGRIFSILINGNLGKAKKMLQEVQTQQDTQSKGSPYDKLTLEVHLNAIGYQLLGAKKTETAIQVFKWVTEMYPDSPNAYDSLADGYEAAGQVNLAIENGEKPSN